MNPHSCIQCGKLTDSEYGWKGDYMCHHCANFGSKYVQRTWVEEEETDKWTTPAPVGPTPQEVADATEGLERILEELS